MENNKKSEIRPISVKTNKIEEELKKDNTTVVLAKAIKSVLNKGNEGYK